MISITVKLPIRDDKLDDWKQVSATYAEAVSAEPGCVFFEFSQSVLEPDTFICIEGFKDAAAGEEHMKQAHVAEFFDTMPDIVSRQPKIIYIDAPDVDGFVDMGEIKPRQ